MPYPLVPGPDASDALPCSAIPKPANVSNIKPTTTVFTVYRAFVPLCRRHAH